MAAGYFFTGEQDLTPEGLDRKRALLNALRKENLSTAPVGHWTQALARVVGAGADSLEEAQLNRTEKAGTEKAKAELMKVLGIGGAASPGAPTAAAGAPASVPAAAPSGGESPASLIRSESGGRWDAQNSAVGAGGKVGHFGRLQFGQARLQDAMNAGAIPQGTTPQQFMASPDLQKAAEAWHFADIDKAIASGPAAAAIGKAIKGVPVTPEGLRAVAHLGGTGGMNKFVQTNGAYDPADANGTRLSAYLAQHAGGGDRPAPSAQTAQFNVPGQVPASPPAPNAQALMAALSNPWAARSPALMQLAASVAGKQLSRDPVEDALKRVQLQQAMRDLTESKPFTIKQDGEEITVVRDAQGRIRRVQLDGEPAGGQQPRMYKLPDGREVPLPSDPTARKKALEEYGTEGAKSIQNAPQAVQSAAQTLSVIDQILGPQNPQTGKFDKPHPALTSRIGTSWGALPALPGTDNAGFDALQKQVQGKAFLEAFQSLKGGGAITVEEGNKAQAAIARLDWKQKPEDYMKALQELREIARTGMERARIIAAGGRPPAQQPAPTNRPGAVVIDGWQIERVN